MSDDNSMFADDHKRNADQPTPPNIAKRVEQHARAKPLGTKPEIFIDWDKIKKLCAIFCTQVEISGVMGIAVSVLSNRVVLDGLAGNWSEFYTNASAKGRLSLRHKQFQKAMDGDVRMMIWLGKNILNQTEKTEVFDWRKEYGTGEEEDADLESVSDDDLDKLRGILIAANNKK